MKPSDYLKRKQGIFLSDYDKIKFDKRFIDKKEIENSETYVKGYQEAREEFERLIDKIFDRMEGFAVNEDVESQLVIERDTFDDFRKEIKKELKE